MAEKDWAEMTDLEQIVREAAEELSKNTIKAPSVHVEMVASYIRDLTPFLRRAVAEEREQCAKVAEEHYSPIVGHYAEHEPYTIGNEIAEAIRERTNHDRA